MDFENISYEKADAVAWITKLCPPEYGMVRGVCVDLDRALDDAADDPEIRVIVISAGGDGFHNGGGPFFTELKPDWDFSSDEFREYCQFGHRLMRKMETLEKPIIGVAKGGAIGGGMEQLHTCDFVVAAETAVFSQPEPRAGLIAGWGGTQRLTRIVGWRKAKELMMGGWEIDGKEAASIGLINKAVPLEKVDEEVGNLIAELKKSGPVALAYTKLCMLKTWEADHRTGLDYEIEAEGMCVASSETKHGVAQLLAGKEVADYQDRPRFTAGPEWK